MAARITRLSLANLMEGWGRATGEGCNIVNIITSLPVTVVTLGTASNSIALQ